MRFVAFTILFAAAGPMFADDDRGRYAFYPLSGIVGKDVFLTFAVDLDPTTGIRDFECSQYTYNGHRGLDVTLASFRQQDIGMPVFAVLDGTVVLTHDGEPDRRLDGGGNSAGNVVVLQHQGTHVTRYFHLRNGSVAVVPGQFVTAGTQLGLAASSGTSTWPHLHFQSEYNGAHYEPSAGPCREGSSYWTNPNQVLLERSFHVGEFGFSQQPYELPATREFFAEDREPRTGTYEQGSTIQFRFALRNVPPQTSYEMRLRRPDGTIAATRSNAYGNAALIRTLFTRASFDLEPNVLGLWSVEIAFNGATMVVAPFLVVASPSEIQNRAPHAIGASIRPAQLSVNDVPRCEVETSLLFEDPDYDVIRYRYEWFVGDRLVREVTSGGLMDALPRDAARPGDRITCRVTPSDGVLEGPSATAEGNVSPPRRRAVSHRSVWMPAPAGIKQNPTGGATSGACVPLGHVGSLCGVTMTVQLTRPFTLAFMLHVVELVPERWSIDDADGPRRPIADAVADGCTLRDQRELLRRERLRRDLLHRALAGHAAVVSQACK